MPNDKVKLASDPNTPAATLRDLASLRHTVGVRSSLAQNPDLSGALLAQLSEDISCRGLVARNPGAPLSLLRKLSQDPLLLLDVLHHPEVEDSLLVAALENFDPEISRQLARHPKATASMLASLAAKQLPLSAAYPMRRRQLRVLALIARHPRAEPTLLVQCLALREERLARAVAQSPNTPEEALLALLKSQDDTTRRLARRNLRTKAATPDRSLLPQR